MKLREIVKLSHRKFISLKTRSTAMVITIGMLFGVLLAGMVILQGLENVELKYAGEKTNYQITLRFGDDPSNLDHVVNFDNIANASNFYDSIIQQKKYITEDGTRQVAVYKTYEHYKFQLYPLMLILMIIAVLILGLTIGHVISQDANVTALYYTLGASKLQVLTIHLCYILEVCFWAMIFAIILALVGVVAITYFGWNHFIDLFTETYQNQTAFPPILFGLNWGCVTILVVIYVSAPLALLLCLDQFSKKSLASKLKKGWKRCLVEAPWRFWKTVE